MDAKPAHRITHAASYYTATANWETNFSPLVGDVTCDVCVVGAGYTGLSAALHLAERGYRVVVVEEKRVAWGASGRNGGQIVTGFSGTLGTVERKRGLPVAMALWDLAEEGKALVRSLIERHAIACDLKSGYLFACQPRHGREARHILATWGHYGYDKLRLLDRDETHRHVASPLYVGGLFDSGGGHLHPLNYALGLARAAVNAGAVIHEGTRVTRLDRGRGAGPNICYTDSGQIRAAHLILAGNAYLKSLVPECRGRIMPVATYMIATEPLTEEQAHGVLPTDIAVADLNMVVDYFRLSPDRRLLFGGGAHYWLGEPHDVKAGLQRRMLRVFPQLSGTGLDYAWGAYVAITLNRLPHFGHLSPSILYAHGYSGQGVALATLAGKLMAETVAGTSERFDLFRLIPHRHFPGGRLRAPLLALVMAYHRLRDAL
ncbi:MAG: FAD-binding oxidoreductase [Alphaproteobacteria bacterium]|nr:FAD-binding oxidoreductase [Alphaproteobacteria bacterium]MBF0129492.1 FAD-binding oxidoreductase [Alphaproteobacteria bacterium]